MSVDVASADADLLGVLIALPLSTPAAMRIRRVLASNGSAKGGSVTRRRGLASPKRGGAASGSKQVASPLQLVPREVFT